MDLTDFGLPLDRCPVCGFRAGRVLPHEALLTVRAIPRRWAELADRYPGEDLARPLGNGPSAIGHAGATAVAFGRAADDLRRLRSAEAPRLSAVPAEVEPSHELPAVLGDLAAQSKRLVAVAKRFRARDWLRSGWRADRQVTGLEILRRAVHEATHRFWEAHHGLARRPTDGSDPGRPPLRSGGGKGANPDPPPPEPRREGSRRGDGSGPVGRRRHGRPRCGTPRPARSGARQLRPWRSVLLGGTGAACVVGGLFVDRWLPGLMLVGLLMLGTAVALDAPVGSLGPLDAEESPSPITALLEDPPDGKRMKEGRLDG